MFCLTFSEGFEAPQANLIVQARFGATASVGTPGACSTTGMGFGFGFKTVPGAQANDMHLFFIGAASMGFSALGEMLSICGGWVEPFEMVFAMRGSGVCIDFEEKEYGPKSV